MIHFATIHGGASEVPVLDTIIANVIEPESNVYGALGMKDREDISRSFLEVRCPFQDHEFIKTNGRVLCSEEYMSSNNYLNVCIGCNSDEGFKYWSLAGI